MIVASATKCNKRDGWMMIQKERNKGIDGDEVTLSCIGGSKGRRKKKERERKRKKRKGDEEERERQGERKESVRKCSSRGIRADLDRSCIGVRNVSQRTCNTGALSSRGTR